MAQKKEAMTNGSDSQKKRIRRSQLLKLRLKKSKSKKIKRRQNLNKQSLKS